MRVLLDTNILIPLEDTDRELPSALSSLKRLASEAGVTFLVHPDQRTDIRRDKNLERRRIVLSRIEQYEEIVSPPRMTIEHARHFGLRHVKPNDVVENQLLYSVRQGAVHALVTEDAEIHRKARRIGISDQVYNTDQMLLFLRRMRGERDVYGAFGLRELPLHAIDVEQEFFDSLRDSYPEFNDWYLRSARTQRTCWAILDDDNVTVKAICIFKKEHRVELGPDVEERVGAFLKLCTFKVDKSIRGMKIGERLLLSAMRRAHRDGCDGIFIHTKGDLQRPLVGLLDDLGFDRVGTYKQDDVYVKEMKPTRDRRKYLPTQFVKRYYPHCIVDERGRCRESSASE